MVHECLDYTVMGYDVRVLMTMWAEHVAFHARCWVGDFAVPGWEGSMEGPGRFKAPRDFGKVWAFGREQVGVHRVWSIVLGHVRFGVAVVGCWRLVDALN